MKKITILYLIGLMLSSIGLMAQKENYKVFPFKSGIIKYKQEGSAKGTHVKYIDKYGYKQADYTETEMKIFGMSTKENTGVILIGPEVYTIDYKANSASVGNNPVYEMYAKSDGSNYEELGKKALASLGFKNTGKTGTVLGKKCTIWDGTMGKIWIWKHLPLKSVTNIMGIKITETAVSIKIGAKIPSNKFKVPSDVKVEKIDTQQSFGGMEDMFGAQDQVSSEDKNAMKQVANMSYRDFRKMLKEEDPDMSEEEIKQTYKMTKQVSKFMK